MVGSPHSGRAPKRGRLSRSADFDRVYRKGKSRANEYLVLYTFTNNDRDPVGDGEDGERTTPRLGLSVSRRVGGAVVRTRVKRLIREAFWAEAQRLSSRCDYVVVARPALAGLSEREGMEGVRKQLLRLITGSDGPDIVARRVAGDSDNAGGGTCGDDAVTCEASDLAVADDDSNS